ncbi:gamma-glutamyltransferase [Planctellipticum variicoloris]|uniref:gamma-glutamyltransferase n=1 Tax=Planctellipticum variicoloris TaxID=3064265 RepID=UPI003013D5C5|nr:gamma-glutamyltransferase [Planctomycetaceae bacterium SH412]
MTQIVDWMAHRQRVARPEPSKGVVREINTPIAKPLGVPPLLLAVLCLAALLQSAPARAQDDVTYRKAVVAADHPLASAAGLEMLQRGGNVVDAAVATSFALSVLRPESSGLGGGGFMVIWDAKTQTAVAIDFRERAPSRSTADMFDKAAAANPGPNPSEFGGLAAGIPLFVPGLALALEKYGTLDLKTVLGPAIRLARDGAPADEYDISTQRNVLKRIDGNAKLASRFKLLRERYLNDGKPLQPGDLVRSPQLPALERLAAEGPQSFTHGPIAQAMLEAVNQDGGVWTAEDLQTMQPTIREPLQAQWDGFDLVTMPPPSSGGIALIESLQILAVWENRSGKRLESLGHNSPEYVHLVTEALKHAFADRAESLGDADFVDVPVAKLLSMQRAERLAAGIDLQRTGPPEEYGRSLTADDGGTTHFSVIDAAGNAVACTETINTAYGSWLVEPKFGIVLNNEMDDFTAHPGKPNAFGLVQSAANAVAPGKRPLSSMTPTILIKDGKAEFAAGASGGPRIITATLQVLLNRTRFDLSPAAAVASPRFHHQWMPDELLLEPALKAAEAGLKERGHAVKLRGNLAASQAAARTPEGLTGGSDPRKRGRPAGE